MHQRKYFQPMQSSVFSNLEAKHSPYRENPEEKSLASDLLHLCNDSLESLWVVNSEVSENLTVDLDTSLVKSTHQLAVAHTIEASSSRCWFHLSEGMD